jgi:hypothetical protein
MAHNTVDTTVLTSDGAVSSNPGKVYWVLVSAVATGGAWQLNDSTDDGGTELWCLGPGSMPTSRAAISR